MPHYLKVSATEADNPCLSQARYDFPIWLADKSKGERFEVFGHVLAEFFNPGDYYETDKLGFFFRWQVEFKF